MGVWQENKGLRIAAIGMGSMLASSILGIIAVNLGIRWLGVLMVFVGIASWFVGVSGILTGVFLWFKGRR